MKKFLGDIDKEIKGLAKQKNVLVIDDENNVRESLNIILTGEYTVHLAEDYKDAKTILENTEVDVVILDVLFPNTTGEEIFKIIKRKKPDTEIIIHSVVSDDRKRIKNFHSLGAYNYLIKPTSIDDIKENVKKAYDKSIVAKVMNFLEKQLGKNWQRKDYISTITS